MMLRLGGDEIEACMTFGGVNSNCEAIVKVAVGRIGLSKITVDGVINREF